MGGLFEMVGKDTWAFSVPNGIKELVPCAFAFASGILAKRGKWLEDLESMPAHTLVFVRALVTALILAKGLLFALYYSGHQGNAHNFDQDALMNGILLIFMPIVLIDLFRRHANGGSFCVKV